MWFKHKKNTPSLSLSHTNVNIPILLTPYTSVFTSLYGYLSVCVYTVIAWNYKHKVLQSSELWIGYLQRSVPSGSIFCCCCGETEQSQRESDRSRAKQERVIWEWRGTERWWHRLSQRVCVNVNVRDREQNCLIDSRQHTKMEEASPVLSVCLSVCSHAPCSSTEMNWYDLNSSSRGAAAQALVLPVCCSVKHFSSDWWNQYLGLWISHFNVVWGCIRGIKLGGNSDNWLVRSSINVCTFQSTPTADTLQHLNRTNISNNILPFTTYSIIAVIDCNTICLNTLQTIFNMQVVYNPWTSLISATQSSRSVVATVTMWQGWLSCSKNIQPLVFHFIPFFQQRQYINICYLTVVSVVRVCWLTHG